MPQEIHLKDVRIAFPVLFSPKAFSQEGGPASDPVYSATFILDPVKHKRTIAQINLAIEGVAKEKWGAKAESVLKTLRASDRTCLHDGNAKAHLEGFEGNQYVAVRSKSRPTIVGRSREMLSSAGGKPYGGSYVDAFIQVWAQDNAFGKRISASFNGVQFVRDGDAFAGGKPADPSKFEAYTDEDGDDEELA